ncbi:MAG TPA: LysR family transcriptional regulator [Burkholderiales bacterium]|jgi:DNA-binding transcriptional LysR family regulator|nr:LysR family transcriptional regulator [Burkholderiales bacterium]
MDRFHLMQLFVRIVEAGSFSAVAREMNMIQPTVSKQLTALEEKLGVRLLNRTTRKLSLTDAGREYYQRCKRILDEVQEMEAEVSELQNRPTGTLRVNAPVAFGQLYLLPLTFQFRRKYPGLAIELSLNDRYVDLIQEGFDVAIRFGELQDSQLVARHVGSSARVCVASPAYLGAKGWPKVPADLKNHNCITYTYLFGNEWHFDGPGGLQPVRVFGDFRANSGLTIRAAALEGIGIANIPAFLVREDIESGRLVQVLSDFGPAPVRISAVYASARLLSRKVKLFVDFMQEEFLKIPLLHPKSPSRPVPRIRAKTAVATSRPEEHY